MALARKVHFRTPIYFKYRYPKDGPGARRADWDVPTDATRPLLQIRAPLAWGCENGAYTAARLRIGVIDAMFDTLQPDLSGRRLWLPPPPETPPFIPHDAVLEFDKEIRSHGTAVAGVLAARTNNNAGVAGMLWESDLTMYSLSRDLLFAEDLVTALDSQISDAIARHVRVIAMSEMFGRPADTGQVARLRVSFKRYLSTGGILVVPTGQYESPQPLRLTIAQLGQTQNQFLGATTRALAQLYAAGFGDRILWVAGTDNAGAFWQPSNFWAGATLVAPATQILLLRNTADGSTTDTSSGTSFAAPYVAGVAGLLLAHDSTLTAAQVKDFILRGARQPRLNPQTGQIAPPPPVAGAPETVYQLDAYGALTLVAQRPGIALCGNRVWAANKVLVAERDPVAHTTEALVNLGEAGPGVNARHGGRRIEVSTALGDRDRFFELRQGQWVEVQDTATTPEGGTFFSMWARSHDWDSAGSFRYWTNPPGDPNPTSASFETNIFVFATQTQTAIDTLVVPTTLYTASECAVQNYRGECTRTAPSAGTLERVVAEMAFPPVGGRLLLAITYFARHVTGLSGWQACPNADSTIAWTCRFVSEEEHTDRAELWAVDLRNRQPTHLWNFPARVFWFGVSEDGAQVVSGEGVGSLAWTGANGQVTYTDPGTVSGCGVRYRRMTDSTQVAPAVLTADACAVGTLGHGTVAPAPPRASGP